MKRVQNASRESQNESQNDFFVRKAIHSSVSGRVWDASFVLERFPKRVPLTLLGLVFETRFNMRTTVGLGLVRHSSNSHTPLHRDSVGGGVRRVRRGGDLQDVLQYAGYSRWSEIVIFVISMVDLV